MRRLSRREMLFSIPLLTALCLFRGLAQSPPNAPVEIRVPSAPMPVRVSGQTLLAYEIHVTNFQSRNITLNRVQVFGGDAASTPVAKFD